MAEQHKKLLIRDSFFSTVFVFVCIAVFALNPFNFHIFNVLGSSLNDIEFTDIIFSGKNPNKGDIQAKMSNDIVLINAADRGREEIASLIDSINLENPAVIGLDFIFEVPKGPLEDMALKDALDRTKKVVVASKFKNKDEDSAKESYSYIGASKSIGNHTEGYANFMITSMDYTVRHLRSTDKDGKVVKYPFALQVVKYFDSSKYVNFLKRHKEFELINYEGNLSALHHFNGNDIMTGNFPKGFLKGKIVLVGFFGSDCQASPVLDDNFYTPMNDKIVGRKFPDTYGIVIQANIINMILKENYVNKTPAWVDWTLGFFICFIHNYIFLRLFVHKHLWYHFLAKMIQLVTTIILIFFCIYLFRQFNIKISASPFIIPVLLTVDMLYFYDTLVKLMHKMFKTKTYFLTGPVHH